MAESGVVYTNIWYTTAYLSQLENPYIRGKIETNRFKKKYNNKDDPKINREYV